MSNNPADVPLPGDSDEDSATLARRIRAARRAAFQDPEEDPIEQDEPTEDLEDPDPDVLMQDPEEEPPMQTAGRSDSSVGSLATIQELCKALQQLNLNKEDTISPVKPIMGGLALGYKTKEAWTGGVPNNSWTGLVSNPDVPLPTQLRPVGSKAADSLIKRTAGIFTDSKSKFAAKGDLDYFCRSLHEHFVMHGMDTVSYRRDPLNLDGPMISVFTHYPCLNSTEVSKQTDWFKDKYDDYDQQNDRAATKCFLNSLTDALKKEIQQRSKPEDLFVDTFVVFVENQRPLRAIRN